MNTMPSTSPADRAFDLFFSVPTPPRDLPSYFRRILAPFEGCRVEEASGTYHVRLRLVVQKARDVDAPAVRGAVADHLRLRAPSITVVGVRAVAHAS